MLLRLIAAIASFEFINSEYKPLIMVGMIIMVIFGIRELTLIIKGHPFRNDDKQ